MIHDVHCWTLASGYGALTTHVLVGPDYDSDGGRDSLLDRITDIAHEEFNIRHITIQVETRANRCLEAHHVAHLVATGRM